MKRFFSFASLLVVALVLGGCPVSSSYPLGEKGSNPINKSLLGNWKTDNMEAEAITLSFKVGLSKNTYAVHVEEKGEMFSADGDDFTGWLTSLGNKTFLVLQQVKDGEELETFYVYHVDISGSKVMSHDISLNVNGTAAITSIESYREEVMASMSTEDFLSSEIVYQKQ